LTLLGEFSIGAGLLKLTDKYLPKPGSSIVYKPSQYIFPLVLMLKGGGRSLEDIRVIKNDEELREVFKNSEGTLNGCHRRLAIAGKIVYHQNQIFLKLHRRFCNLFKTIRLRIWEFSKI
jgi:hypothetical protein